VFLAGGLALSVALSPAAGADSADTAFYRGKTLTYLVAAKPGGGYDSYARLIADALPRHLPGVRVRVRNVPGAGHIVGANMLYAAAPDGLTIGTFNTGLIYAQLLGREGIRFDLHRFAWIGKAASDPRVAVLATDSPYHTVADLRQAPEPVVFGTAGLGAASHTETVLLARALGLALKPVIGYGGDGAQMGLLRGELTGSIGSYSSFRTFIDNGFGRLAFRIGGDRAIGAAAPDATTLAVDETGRALVALIRHQSELGRLTAAPPGTPTPRLAALRKAYMQTLADPALLAQAATLRLPIDPLPGDAVAASVTAALDQDPAVRDLLRAAMAGGE